MQGGRLRHRVRIEEKNVTRNEYGEEVISWVAKGTYWASVEPLSGRELAMARQDTAEISVRIRMRYISGIDTAMRAVHGSNVYDIETVVHVRERQAELHLMCRRHT